MDKCSKWLSLLYTHTHTHTYIYIKVWPKLGIHYIVECNCFIQIFGKTCMLCVCVYIHTHIQVTSFTYMSCE
jgi:hypothetical protein